MITIDNQEVKDLTIDGTPVNEVTMDGIIVWKRLSDIWKRRIIAGDNLPSGTVLYHDWSNIASQMLNYNGSDYESIITAGLLFHRDLSGLKNSGPPFVIEIEENFVWQGWSDSEEDILENHISTELAKNYNNIQILKSANPIYRRVFIEDPNIRPVEVGDNLSGATLYYTFPDNYDEIYGNTGFVFRNNNYVGIEVMNHGDELEVLGFDEEGSQHLYIYRKFYNENEVVYNKSKDASAFVIGDLDRVDYVNKNHSAYKHILVDTTTMGN